MISFLVSLGVGGSSAGLCDSTDDIIRPEMEAGAMLREARRGARLTQRALAREARVPQPTVARIESGAVVPRVDTLERLLAACGRTLSTAVRPGAGVDRSLIRRLLAASPRERLEMLTEEARNLDRLLALAERR